MYLVINMMSVFVIIMKAMMLIVEGKTDGSLIIPPGNSGPDTPTCSSYSSVCHLAYNITEKSVSQIFHSYSQICRCPEGLKCPTEWHDMSNSLVKAFKNAGEEMQVKFSYCKMNSPTRRCKQNEPAVVMRGRGPFLLELYGDFKCKCNRPLYAHQSWIDGPYNYVEYSCGKPRCGTNRHPETRCTKVSFVDVGNYHHEYLCRCKWNEECLGGILPTSRKLAAYRYCQSVRHNDYYRRKQRRNRPKISNKTRRATKT